MTRIFLVAGETSGDMLGAALMRALRNMEPCADFAGVGGRDMTAAGLASLFPLEDIAVMGLTPVLARLPLLARRLDETVRSVLADPPDCLVLIDAPDFTHRVARRVRAANPAIPIVDYVCPSVWAWRPGRARAMRAYVDRVLAILPFEPAAVEDSAALLAIMSAIRSSNASTNFRAARRMRRKAACSSSFPAHARRKCAA